VGEVLVPVFGLLFAFGIGIVVYVLTKPHRDAVRVNAADLQWKARLRELEETLNNILVAEQSGANMPTPIVEALNRYFPGNRMPNPPSNHWQTTERVMRAERIFALVLEQRDNGLLVLPPQVDGRVDAYKRGYYDN
jgi:hypothetical protein